ncbi:MAG: sigma-E processing peptidase SpoIIGA [Firmicutes bacterium]|nr:sigma-E processing peptidase SpoIIGA [Bacillota bacterium]
MYIYADIILAVNVVMNSFILILTGWSAGIDYKVWRAITAAFLGGVYSLGEVTVGIALLYTPMAKALVSVIIIYIAFGKHSWRSFIVSIVWFYIIAFLIGGAVFGWLFFVGASYTTVPGNEVWITASWQHIVMGTLLVMLLFLVALRRVKADTFRRQLIYQVIVYYGGRQERLMALLDTGNRLFTATGQTPVVVVEHKAIETLLSEAAKSYLKEHLPAMWLVDMGQCHDQAWLDRVQCIPFRGVGGSSMLLGFRPDRMVVVTKKGRIETDSVVIGVYSGSIDAAGAYNALLHPGILQFGSGKEGANICA